jgi:chromate transporter
MMILSFVYSTIYDMNGWRLFSTFFKIGTFTFGGGYAMLPLIEQEVVHKQQWLNTEEYTEMLSLVQTAPGPISINSAVFIGYKLHQWKGALSCLLGVILPSFIIILLIAVAFTEINSNPIVERIFKGIRPAVVALIAVPVIRMIQREKLHWIGGFIALISIVIVWLLGYSPVWVVLGAIVYGIVKEYVTTKRKQS